MENSLTESFKNKLEMVQHNAALFINGAIKGISHDCIYREFGLEYLAEWSQSLKILFFCKIINVVPPSNLQSYITVGKDFIKQDQHIETSLDNFYKNTNIWVIFFFLLY